MNGFTTETFVFDIPSHIQSEFGRLSADILRQLDFLHEQNIINEKRWLEIKNTIFTNVNSVKRNMILLVGHYVAEQKN